jgi:CheY-like chemotaxis protein
MPDPLDLDVKALGKTLRQQASGFRHLADETLGDFRSSLLALATDYDRQASTLECGSAADAKDEVEALDACGKRPGSLHVLVVEDEPLVREALHETLQAQYDVSCASTVGEACEFLGRSRVDLVLVDSILPDGHGDDIATIADTLGVPTIAMSGYPPEIDRPDRPHLMKPFKANLLFSTIEAAIRMREPNPTTDTTR